MASLPPPSYSVDSSSTAIPSYESSYAPPPDYVFPSTFHIGSTRTTPLVNNAQVKGHLVLLRAFADLRARVDSLASGSSGLHSPQMPQDKDRRWAWFVGLAVERFERWIKVIQSTDSQKRAEDILPPIDVIMVWHAYMLNPGWYVEDCTRHPSLVDLKSLGRVFSSLLPNMELFVSLKPSNARILTWETRTSTIFDPFLDAVRQTEKILLCPICESTITAPLMTDSGHGYLQEHFVIGCPSKTCESSPSITKEALGVRKLKEDILRNDGSHMAYLAGTLHSPNSGLDIERAKRIKDTIIAAPEFRKKWQYSNREWVDKVVQNEKLRTWKAMKNLLIKTMRARGGKLVGRIMRAYMDDKIFSVDLVGAVIRQGSFVNKMRDLHWTDPTFFESKEDEIALLHCIARYHAFLDLMTSSPVAFFVPTLDIDLAWHTHQLLSLDYGDNCTKLVGRFIDHDDKVEEGKLSSAFDLTCRAWQTRFNMPYTHCGCPIPGTTIGQRLSRLVSSNTYRPSYLVPPNRDDLLAATHPSDHNAVFVMHKNHQGIRDQQRRREKFAKRQKMEEEQAKNGKLDPRRVERSYGHDPAFLVPVPLYYYYPILPGCAAISHNVADNSASSGAGGCAAGAGGCAVGSAAGCGGSGSACGGGCGGGGGDGGGGGGGCGGGCGGG